MAQWKVTFECGTGKEGETYEHEITVSCHWSYNAPKVAFKELDETQQGEVERNTLSVKVEAV